MSPVSQIGEAELFRRAASLSVPDVIAYLLRNGWSRSTAAGRSMVIWELPGLIDRPPAQVFVPLNSRLQDYGNRMVDVLTTLAELERRDPVQVLDDLKPSGFQTHRIRFLTDTEPGMISLNSAARIHDAVRDFFLAGAVTVAFGEEPPLVHPARKPAEARRFVEGALLAPSGASSYVVTVRTPTRLGLPAQHGPEVEQGPFSSDEPASITEEPFGRRVSRKLSSALTAARATAEAGQLTQSSVDEFLDLGLSANLCDALARFGGTGRDRVGFEVEIAAANDQALLRRQRSVYFSPDDAWVLKQVADQLKTTYALAEVTLRGKVLQLDRPSRTGSGPGTVTIVGRFDGDTSGQERHVRVHLEEDDYSAATRAHDDGLSVVVQGDLIPSGTRLHVRAVRQFTVVTTSER